MPSEPWEIAHLENFHLEKYPWENATWEKSLRKVPNIPNLNAGI